VVAHWTNGATCWFGGDYLNARTHLEQALATYDAQLDLESFRTSSLALPFVIMRFLALVLWPMGQIDRACRLAAEALRPSGQQGSLAPPTALVAQGAVLRRCGV